MAERLAPLDYYKWHWKRFRLSRNCQRLHYVARGFYRELLDEQFAEGFVPDDIALLADICGCPLSVMQEHWSSLEKFFPVVAAGQRVNPNQEEHRTELDQKRAQQARAGRISAGIRQAKVIPHEDRAKRVSKPSTRKAYLLGKECAHCGVTEKLVLDHVIPIARGGSDEPHNWQPLCGRCNTNKGSSLEEELPRNQVVGTDDKQAFNERSTPHPVNVQPEEKRREEKSLSVATQPHPSASLGVVDKHPDLLIYEAYPRREGKRKALEAIGKAIARLVKGEAPQPPMLKLEAQRWLFAHTLAYARSPAGQNPDRSMIPHPSTWFNQSRYDDDQANWKHTGGNTSNGKPTRIDTIAESSRAALAILDGVDNGQNRNVRSLDSGAATRSIFESADDSLVAQDPGGNRGTAVR